MKRKGLVICAIAASAVALAGAAWGQGADQGLNIAIATGGTGGVYYPLGGGMANVLSKYVPGVQATARVTGGSVDNLKLIGSQQSEVALVMVDAALDALKGEDKFKGAPVEVRTLMVLYPNRMHVVSMEGTRPLLVEVQALVTPSNFGNARCTTNGIEHNRLLMLLAVLTKRVGLAVGTHDVYANVVGGFTLEEPAVDLGVAAAIASSYREKHIPPDMALIGEIGLSGELRRAERAA